jgi:hypothetical protein
MNMNLSTIHLMNLNLNIQRNPKSQINVAAAGVALAVLLVSKIYFLCVISNCLLLFGLFIFISPVTNLILLLLLQLFVI